MLLLRSGRLTDIEEGFASVAGVISLSVLEVASTASSETGVATVAEARLDEGTLTGVVGVLRSGALNRHEFMDVHACKLVEDAALCLGDRLELLATVVPVSDTEFDDVLDFVCHLIDSLI